MEVIFWLAVAVSYYAFPGHLVLLSQLLIAGAFVVSLDLLLGYTGIASFGHAAFFGIGAYTAALVARGGVTEPLLGLVVCAGAAALVGLLFGLLVVRLNGIALVVVTLSVGLLFYELANRLSSITGGESGLSEIPVGKLFGMLEWDIEGRVAFWYSAAIVFLIYVLARHIVQSPFGLALQGIRDNVHRIPAIGISVRRRSVVSFTLAAAFAGVAGALLTQTSQNVSLEALSFDRSMAGLVMLAMGGTGTLIGGMLGATLYTVARDILANLNPVYWNFWLGLVLVILVLIGSGGLVGGLKRVRDRVAAMKAEPRE